MEVKVVDLKCPNCGGVVTIEQKTCAYCGSTILVTSMESADEMSPLKMKKYINSYSEAVEKNPKSDKLWLSLGVLFLKLKLFEKATNAFEKAMEDNFDDSEVYFYAAVSLLEGRTPFVLSRDKINKVIEYANAAVEIEPKPSYYYFLAFVKYDYFERKYFKTTPNYAFFKNQALSCGFNSLDKSKLFGLLGVKDTIPN